MITFQSHERSKSASFKVVVVVVVIERNHKCTAADFWGQSRKQISNYSNLSTLK